MVREMPLFEGLQKGYSLDTPEEFHGRVRVKLKELDEDEGTENWPFRELVGS